MSATDTLADVIRAAVRDEIAAAVAARPEVRLLRAREVAERLGVSERRVDALLTSGEVASVRVGHARRVRTDVLDAYIDSLDGGQP